MCVNVCAQNSPMVTISVFSMDWSNRVLRTFVIDQANYKSITKYRQFIFTIYSIALSTIIHTEFFHTEQQLPAEVLIIVKQQLISTSYFYTNVAWNPKSHININFFLLFLHFSFYVTEWQQYISINGRTWVCDTFEIREYKALSERGRKNETHDNALKNFGIYMCYM